jgi:hypothetical protein
MALTHHNFAVPNMTSDLSTNANESLEVHAHLYEGMERINSAPTPEIPTSLSSATRYSTRRASTMRGSTSGSVSSSRNKLNRQSIKFSNKSFVTRWAGDLEKDYKMGVLLG